MKFEALYKSSGRDLYPKASNRSKPRKYKVQGLLKAPNVDSDALFLT